MHKMKRKVILVALFNMFQGMGQKQASWWRRGGVMVASWWRWYMHLSPKRQNVDIFEFLDLSFL